jgi:hypothetical protein
VGETLSIACWATLAALFALPVSLLRQKHRAVEYLPVPGAPLLD